MIEYASESLYFCLLPCIDYLVYSVRERYIRFVPSVTKDDEAKRDERRSARRVVGGNLVILVILVQS